MIARIRFITLQNIAIKMLRYNGPNVERRRMYPNFNLNSYFHHLDLSWTNPEQPPPSYLTPEQRKQLNRHQISRIYTEKATKMEEKIFKDGISSYEDQLSKQVKAFDERRRSQSMDSPSPVQHARMTPTLPQVSHVENIIYEPHSSYTLGNSTLLHRPPF